MTCFIVLASIAGKLNPIVAKFIERVNRVTHSGISAEPRDLHIKLQKPLAVLVLLLAVLVGGLLGSGPARADLADDMARFV